MVIDKDLEKEIREYIYKLNGHAVERRFQDIKKRLAGFSDFEIICYALLLIDNQFKKDSLEIEGIYKNSTMYRVVLEWFIKMILKKDVKKRRFKFDKVKFDGFSEYIVEISLLFTNYALNERFKQGYGIGKYAIEIDHNNEYYFKVPNIKDKIDCQESYFWSNTNTKDNLGVEIEFKEPVPIKLMYKYIINKKGNLNKLISLEEIDDEIYNICKKKY